MIRQGRKTPIGRPSCMVNFKKEDSLKLLVVGAYIGGFKFCAITKNMELNKKRPYIVESYLPFGEFNLGNYTTLTEARQCCTNMAKKFIKLIDDENRG